MNFRSLIKSKKIQTLVTLMTVFLLIETVVASVDTSKVGVSVDDEWEVNVIECTIQGDCIWPYTNPLVPGDTYSWRLLTLPNSTGWYEAEQTTSKGDIFTREMNFNWFLSPIVYTDWDYWGNDGALDILNMWFMKTGKIEVDNSDTELFKAKYTIAEENTTHFLSDPPVYGFLNIDLELEYQKGTGIKSYHYMRINSSDPWYQNGTTELAFIHEHGTDDSKAYYEVFTTFLLLAVVTPVLRKRQNWMR